MLKRVITMINNFHKKSYTATDIVQGQAQQVLQIKMSLYDELERNKKNTEEYVRAEIANASTFDAERVELLRSLAKPGFNKMTEFEIRDAFDEIDEREEKHIAAQKGF